jgi:hypothetical protein
MSLLIIYLHSKHMKMVIQARYPIPSLMTKLTFYWPRPIIITFAFWLDSGPASNLRTKKMRGALPSWQVACQGVKSPSVRRKVSTKTLFLTSSCHKKE